MLLGDLGSEVIKVQRPVKATIHPPLRYRSRATEPPISSPSTVARKHRARSEDRGKDVRRRLVDVSHVLRLQFLRSAA